MEFSDAPSNQEGHMSYISGPATELGPEEGKGFSQALTEMTLEDKEEEDKDEDNGKDEVKYETVVREDGGLGRIINGVIHLIFLDVHDNEQLVPLNDKFYKFMQEIADKQALKPQPQP